MFAPTATIAALRGTAATAIALRAPMAGRATLAGAAGLAKTDALVAAGVVAVAAALRSGLDMGLALVAPIGDLANPTKDMPNPGIAAPCGFTVPGFEGKRCEAA